MSQRTRTADYSATLPATMYARLPQLTKTLRAPADKPSSASQRLSLTSNSSTGRRSSTSLEGSTESVRPSAIPRPTRKSSGTRLDILPTSKPAASYTYRPKATLNITGIATRTALRNRPTERAAPTNNTPRIVTDEDFMSLEPSVPSFDTDHDTVFGIAVPQKRPPHVVDLPPRLIPELQALAAISNRRPTPAMSTISTISSPSTQFTTSPGPWSASTTATTPTSWSSASPSILQPKHPQSISKRSHTIPIPSSGRTNMPKLPVLRETSLNGASASKTQATTPAATTPKRVKKTPRTSPAPTPPPRTSSITRTRSRSNSKTELSPHPRKDSVPPLPRETEVSPIVRHVQATADRSEQHLQPKTHPLTDHHKKLQDALNSAPPRPSRDGTDDLEIRKPQRVYPNHTKYDEHARRLLDAAPIEALPQTNPQPSLELSRASEQGLPIPTQPSRSRLAKFSKLALFARSPKKTLPVEPESSQQPQKLQKRGPIAGTGHEGYGRFGRKDRRTSTDGHTTGTDSESSVASTRRKPLRSISRNERSASGRRDRNSQSDLDDFAASRLKPVVIVGGSRKVSGGQSLIPVQDDFVNDMHNGTRESLSSSDPTRHISVTSSDPLLSESRLIFHLDSLDTREPRQLVPRRSQRFGSSEQIALSRQAHTDPLPSQPYLSGYNTSQSSIAPSTVAMAETSGDYHAADSYALDKARKKSRKLKWGFFRRKEASPELEPQRPSSRSTNPSMPVRISSVPPPRPIPHYAMLESENEGSDTITLGQFLAEATRDVSTDEDEDIVSPFEELEAEPVFLERANSVLLPSTPLLRVDDRPTEKILLSRTSSQAKTNVPTPVHPVELPRRPRLPQVGRIPKVVPTTQMNPPTQLALSGSVSEERALERQPSVSREIRPPNPTPLVIHTDLLPSRQFHSPDSGKPSSAPARTETDRPVPARSLYTREAPRFPDRYSTTSSSSDGVISVMGPPLLPAPDFPIRSIRYTTTEEDVWNEYDDFIDGMMSPRLQKSKARITEADRMRSVIADQYEPECEGQPIKQKASRGLSVDTSLAPPPLLFASSGALRELETDQDFRLRRSRIISALHSSLDPSSPFSIGDYLAELGDPQRDSGRASGRFSDPAASPGGVRSPRMVFTFPEPPVSQVEHQHHENAVQMDEVERSKDPMRHSEGSYASLMVSRWLSFGRVLFSPAHGELQKQTERHVLVIDGLGNDDWSIYCAVTYQTEQAYIYDLKETGHTRHSASPTKTSTTPQNFRRREVASFNEAFNFPDNFFSVIVLRFPPVMAESKLKNIVSECRRILAPGGYMELMLLDLDIVNMGVLTRRTMRNLKTQIAMRNREVSLKPVIDNVQHVLGEKGFSKLSKCVVGVPVVGKPPSAESPTSSRSSGASDRTRITPSAGPQPLDGLKSHRHHNFSLNDFVADHSEHADAKISKAVSRTARSWWQHCFEAAVISDGNLAKSIFADRAVLNECKNRASSFRLLIAHAQKPAGPAISIKRRTMSEPVISTLATAGTP